MAKRNVFKRWEKRGLKFKIITSLGIILFMLAAPLLLISLMYMAFAHIRYGEVFHKGLFWGLYALSEFAIFMIFLFEYRALGSRRVLKVNKDLEDSHFLEMREIAQDDGFTVTDFENLSNVNDGLLVMAERVKNKMRIVLANPIHAALIATTGSGKSAAYVSPFLEIMARTATKPCIVVTDPKGELYERHANTLSKNGYNVHHIDMSNTYISTLWNPFNDIIKKTERINEPIILDKGKYRWNGRMYPTYIEANQRKQEYSVRLNDEIYIDLQDLIYTMCPVENQTQKNWEQGARDLIFAMALRMWEDLRDGYLPKEKFNIYNLWWNLTEYAKNDCKLLIEYIETCAPEGSRAPGMASTVLVSQDVTLASYLGSVNQYLHWLADGGVAQLTSGNEIEFSEWDDEPNVLFIKIPTAKEGRRTLVTLMLVQLYKALLEKSELNAEVGATKDACLKRNCYFLMDEFGALPKIHEFEQKITFSRSYKVFFMPVVQSYEQLNAVYGQHGASIIRDNCNVKIFMGTNDDKTRNEISEACGKHKIKSVSYNESKDMSVSTSAQSVPLIYPAELLELNNPKNGIIGNAVVLVTGTYPIRARTTPYFKAMDIYGIEQGARAERKDFMIFDEAENRYNVARLIYLLQDEEEEQQSEEEAIEEVTQQIAEEEIRNAALERLKKQIEREIGSLKGKISDNDFLRLAVADSKGKMMILDELAERATSEGNIFLAMRIEKLRGFIKHSDLSLYTQATQHNGKSDYQG